MRKAILIVLLAVSNLAGAYTVVEGAREATAMKAGEIYYSAQTFPFEEWKEGAEKNALNLFPGFRDGYSKDQINMFIAKASFVIDRPPSQLPLKAFLDQTVIQHLQQGLTEVKPIESKDLQVLREPFLEYRSITGQPWCATGADRTCLHSHFILDSSVQVFLSAILLMKGSTDGEINAESEVRVLGPDQIKNLGFNLADVTQVKTDVVGVVVEDFFYFNHFLEFSKVLGVVQAHPSDASKSIITSYAVFAIERKWWEYDSLIDVQSVLLGKAHNYEEGLLMGLPKVTQQLFGRLADWLSQAKN